jgi:peptide/nickel transport system substrate-binding protein
MGIKNPAVDALIAAMLKARDRVDFTTAVRALDRVLMSGFYVLPLYNLPGQWIARSSEIAFPDKTSLAGALPETWWRVQKAAR